MTCDGCGRKEGVNYLCLADLRNHCTDSFRFGNWKHARIVDPLGRHKAFTGDLCPECLEKRKGQ
jgi:hypothetical protein